MCESTAEPPTEGKSIFNRISCKQTTAVHDKFVLAAATVSVVLPSCSIGTCSLQLLFGVPARQSYCWGPQALGAPHSCVSPPSTVQRVQGVQHFIEGMCKLAQLRHSCACIAEHGACTMVFLGSLSLVGWCGAISQHSLKLKLQLASIKMSRIKQQS